MMQSKNLGESISDSNNLLEQSGYQDNVNYCISSNSSNKLKSNNIPKNTQTKQTPKKEIKKRNKFQIKS